AHVIAGKVFAGAEEQPAIVVLAVGIFLYQHFGRDRLRVATGVFGREQPRAIAVIVGQIERPDLAKQVTGIGHGADIFGVVIDPDGRAGQTVVGIAVGCVYRQRAISQVELQQGRRILFTVVAV